MEKFLTTIRGLIPQRLFKVLQPLYHFSMSYIGAALYGFPSRKLILIAVTGSKGKTTTTELVNSILENAGYKTVLANTLRFKIASRSERNLQKMTMPGRFFLQRLLKNSLKENCTHAIIEMSSEGAKQFRHRFLSIDALIFTNLEKEHIESHGSYENYVAAKLEIAKQLLRSGKKKSLIVLNRGDKEASRFAQLGIADAVWYGLEDAKPYQTSSSSTSFVFRKTPIVTSLVGEFNLLNMLAASTLAEKLLISRENIKKALEEFGGIRGRVEKISVGQAYDVIVDYAHTPNSLENLYRAFEGKHLICVLSGTGGGRDKWKRPLMGEIADRYCSEIILTDEDPYDEDPRNIVEEISKGITQHQPKIVMDRREAIREALSRAKVGDMVLLTGKGTDPYIMTARGGKIPWDEAAVAKEELLKINKKVKYSIH